MSNLKGTVALVTGGSKGIGKATTLALVKAGAQVAIVYASDANSAHHLVDEVGSDKLFAICADASSIKGADEMVSKTVEHFGKMDILVLCAGTSPMRTMADTTETDFDKAIEMNVKGPYFVAQKAANVMKSGSHIVFISSSLCRFSSIGAEWLLYCACKGAIEQVARVLSRDLARRDITVNAVAPGPVEGDHFKKDKSPEAMASITRSIPAGRLSLAEEVADAIAFLCSHESRWVTGQVLYVNGGMT